MKQLRKWHVLIHTPSPYTDVIEQLLQQFSMDFQFLLSLHPPHSMLWLALTAMNKCKNVFESKKMYFVERHDSQLALNEKGMHPKWHPVALYSALLLTRAVAYGVKPSTHRFDNGRVYTVFHHCRSPVSRPMMLHVDWRLCPFPFHVFLPTVSLGPLLGSHSNWLGCRAQDYECAPMTS